VFVVDTNLLLYALNPAAPEHARARALIGDWQAGVEPWFLTWGIVYEFLRVSTHRRVFERPLELRQAQEWVASLLATPNVGMLVETERHDEVLREVTGLHPRLGGNVVHDLHTAVLMREHGIAELRTADTDFHQFGFLRVVNPLVG
jgi:toxin-antitoxin system PIN domain toxin